MPQIKFEISNELYKELKAATVNEPGETPRSWARDAVEAALATRRLPRVRPSTSVPRMSGTVETAMLDGPQFVEHRAAGPLDPSEVPTLLDAEGLADIR